MKKGHLNEIEVRNLLTGDLQEENNMEYKREYIWESESIRDQKEYEWKKNNIDRFKIFKAILSFSNTQNGGYLVLGVEEAPDGVCHLRGMSERYWDTFPNSRDHILSQINGLCREPNYTNFDYFKGMIDGYRVIAFRVHESLFDVVVAKGNHPLIKAGVVYCRSGRIPESTEATPKLLRKIRRRLRKNANNLEFLDFIQNYITGYKLNPKTEAPEQWKGITLYTQKGNVRGKIYIEFPDEE
ncbi:MAG TPA: ATP-binding protein [Bacillota bacterium]|nr:ATP-binding protein [Bacillota bacterium]